MKLRVAPVPDLSGDVDRERVLELRIHGVKNTSPYDMLDVPEGEVELTAGDDLGSFWRPTAASLARTRNPPPPKDDLDPIVGDDGPVLSTDARRMRGSVPDGVRREAYSWGGMVRSVPPGTGPGGAIVAGLARACWTLLLPFSIANAAIWSWALPRPTEPDGRISARAGIIRLCCLMLTALLALSLISIAVNLLALQCYRGGVTVCTPLVDTMETFAGWRDEKRIAVFSLLPIIGLLAVYVTSTLSRLKYSVAGRLIGRSASEGTPGVLLQHPDFWKARTETGRLAMNHLSIGVGFVALVCSLALWRTFPVYGPVLTALAVSGMLAAAVLTFCTDSLPFEKLSGRVGSLPHLVLGIEVGLYVVAALTLGVWTSPIDIPRYGLITAFEQVLLWTVVGALVLIAITLFFRAPARRYRAWGGRAPSVFLTTALAISLLYGSVLNVVVGDWMNGPADAQRLLRDVRRCAGVECTPQDLTIGGLYPTLLGVLLAGLLVVVLIVLIAMVVRRVVDRRVDAMTTIGDSPVPAELTSLLGREVASKRRWAARAHLAEPVFGVTAVTIGIAIPVALVLAFRSEVSALIPGWGVEAWSDVGAWMSAVFDSAFVRTWIAASLGVWAVIGAAIAAGLVFGGSKAGRPLALIWDLACFLLEPATRSGLPATPRGRCPRWRAA